MAWVLAWLLLLGGPLFAQEEPLVAPGDGAVAEDMADQDASGETTASDETTTPDSEAPPPDVEPPAPEADPPAARVPQRVSEASEAALAFSERFRVALALEFEIQEYEHTTLALQDSETLNGFPLQRWHRIEADRDFKQVATQVSLQPLRLPSPGAARHLGKKTQLALFDLGRAYERSRKEHSLEPMINLGRGFLKQLDWGLRDRSVRVRDLMIQREIEYTRLGKIAADVVNGDMGEADAILEIRTALKSLAPELEIEVLDMAVLVLEDESARALALSDIAALLSVEIEQAVPPRQLPQLLAEVTVLYDALIDATGLHEVIDEYEDLTNRLDRTVEKIATLHGRIDVLTEKQKVDKDAIKELRDHVREVVDEQVFFSKRRNELVVEWYSTPIDLKIYEMLVAVYEEMAWRMMIDLGAPGALFGTQFDLLKAERERTSTDDWSRWMLLDDQQDLLVSLNEAWPALDPLKGLKPPSVQGQWLLKQAQLKAAGGKGAKSGPPKSAAKKPKNKGGKKKPR